MTQQVNTIFTNAFILTMDETLTQFSPGALAVQGDSIIAVGLEEDIRKEYIAEETIDCGGKVLMPGLINAHTHVPMTLLRGLADDLRLDVWLMGYMMPVEREFVSPESVRLGTLLACAEQIRSGVTTFNDMYYFEEDVARAASNRIGLDARGHIAARRPLVELGVNAVAREIFKQPGARESAFLRFGVSDHAHIRSELQQADACADGVGGLEASVPCN